MIVLILAIVGPTGVGKTKLSIALAKKYNGIIVNCDAVQVYQELNIGSAKITEEEKEGIPHYLFDITSPLEKYTVYHYQKDLRKIIANNKNQTIILVGGTGLYLKAGLYDYQFPSEENVCTYENFTNDEIYELALKKDSHCSIHKNNRQRLIRFLNQENACTNSKPLYKAIFIGLTTDRKLLYQKINERVDKMLADGLVAETKHLLEKYPQAPILSKAIGYKEIKKYLNSETSYEEAVEEIKKNSRHYAKRQYTFFHHQLPVVWFDVNYNNFALTIEEVEKYIDNKKS